LAKVKLRVRPHAAQFAIAHVGEQRFELACVPMHVANHIVA
jgi:hypothetical protein